MPDFLNSMFSVLIHYVLFLFSEENTSFIIIYAIYKHFSGSIGIKPLLQQDPIFCNKTFQGCQ